MKSSCIKLNDREIWNYTNKKATGTDPVASDALSADILWTNPANYLLTDGFHEWSVDRMNTSFLLVKT